MKDKIPFVSFRFIARNFVFVIFDIELSVFLSEQHYAIADLYKD
jgi:hypothetical protein